MATRPNPRQPDGLPRHSTTANGKTFPTSAPQPHLLKQMNMMMENWRPYPPQPTSEDIHRIDSFNVETCRNVLRSYDAAAGQYQPLLSQLHDFIFKVVDYSLDTAAAMEGAMATRESDEMAKPERGPKEVNGALVAAEEQKAIHAFHRVEAAEGRMKNVIEEARSVQANLQDQAEKLQAENKKLADQLEYSIVKASRRAKEGQTLDVAEFEKERSILDLQKTIDDLRGDVAELKREAGVQFDKKKNLLKLNKAYARQAVELAARVRVYSEKNEKFAYLLSSQHDDRLVTEKENELLRAELLDLNRFHALRDNLEGEVGQVAQTIELRSNRYVRGNNPSVPAHLKMTTPSGMINRISIPKEAALAMVSDILMQRNAHLQTKAPVEFDRFIQQYLSKHKGDHAITWSYSLDEASSYFDADCNLNLFGMVSRKQLAELLFRDIATDISIFVQACEVVDKLQHGETKLTVPVLHVLGVLLEMFPGYPTSVFSKFLEQLRERLTTNAQAHYRMLFPNLEREEMTVNPEASFSTVELRQENVFSRMFKELIIDDAAVSMQVLEDHLLSMPAQSGDRVTESEIRGQVSKMYEQSPGAVREVMGQISKTIQDHLGTTGQSKYEITISKTSAAQVLRQKAVIRRGIFRKDGTDQDTYTRLQAIMSKLPRSDQLLMMNDSVADVDYREVLTANISTCRRSYLPDGGGDEFDIEGDEENEEGIRSSEREDDQ